MANNQRYVDRITNEAYEHQKLTYTQQMLNELGDSLRKDPTLLKKTSSYRQSHKRYQLQEFILKTTFYGLLVIVLFYWYWNTGVASSSIDRPRLSIELSDLFCENLNDLAETVDSTVDTPVHNPNLNVESRLMQGKQFIFTPPFLVFFSIFTFLVWITRMQLDKGHFLHEINFTKQVIRNVLSVLVPFLTMTIFGLASVIFTRASLLTPSCVHFVHSLLDTPVVGEVIQASFTLIEYTPFNFSPRINTFFVYCLFLTMAFFVSGRVINMITKRSVSDFLIAASLIAAISSSKALEGEMKPQEKRGELYILFVSIAKFVSVLVDLVKYYNSIINSKFQSDVPIAYDLFVDDEDDDEDDKKEQ